jgi:hypothetical protein
VGHAAALSASRRRGAAIRAAEYGPDVRDLSNIGIKIAHVGSPPPLVLPLDTAVDVG